MTYSSAGLSAFFLPPSDKLAAVQMITALVGGVGLFLLGMMLLTDGLKAAAGDALRRLLSNFTGGPLKALLSGAGITALVQSSSATTLATIGFVSAGLLTFPQAVGVVFGANLGTTATGWIVSLVGLKLQMAALALPMIAAGVLLKLASHGRRAAVGLAVAGFGLIFLGIDVLQAAMRDVGGWLDPASLPGDTPWGRVALVGVGAAMTVVMQSSSAALATTLTALSAGTIQLHHGAALVIGQNLGTTVTAAFAAIGASVPARRTAAAHIGFNLITGAVALLILPLLLAGLEPLRNGGGGPATLAAFHTVFNLLGVVLLFPFIERFAGAITRLVPERRPLVTRNLDASVAAVPAVAIEAVRRTLIDILTLAAQAARQATTATRAARAAVPEPLGQALAEARRFAGTVGPPADSPAGRAQYLSLFHAMDHLDQLVAAAEEPLAEDVRARPGLAEARATVTRMLDAALAWLTEPARPAPVETLEALSTGVAEMRRGHRHALLERTAFGQESTEHGVAELAAMRWLDRVGYHTWRAVHHLAGAAVNGKPAPDAAIPAADASMPAPDAP